MHAYFGVSQFHSAPTSLETVHQFESEALFNNNNNELPLDVIPSVQSLPHVAQGALPGVNGSATDAVTTAEEPNMASYPSPSTYFPPISTTPNVIFRSPSQYIPTATMAPVTPLLPPTIISPPIQMVAPTTLSSSNGSWQHTIPLDMPWNSGPGSSTVIKFTANHNKPTVSEVVKNAAARGPKRKHGEETIDTDVAGGKVHVNEEMMSARMQELTLDNNNLDWVPNLEESWYSRSPHNGEAYPSHSMMPVISHDDESSDSHDSTGSDLPKLELSDLLKINMSTKEILPKLIMEQLSKPCMQVVLWKPPGDFVTEVVQNMSSSSSANSSSSPNMSCWSGENGKHSEIEIDPATVPLPDDDDMEL